MFSAVLLSILCATAYATFCVPNLYLPSSRLEKACNTMPYRSHFVAGRCFFAVTTEQQQKDVCHTAGKFNALVAHKATLANIESKNLDIALKQSNAFNPKNSYEVKKHADGSTHFMAKSQSSGYSYLCEARDTAKCGPQSEMLDGRCFKVNTNSETAEDALTECSKSEGGSLASVRSDFSNRFVASLARARGATVTGAVWVGINYMETEDGTYWASLRDLQNIKKAGYYRWLHTENGMYTQQPVRPAKANNAALLFSATSDSNGQTSFGYWGNDNMDRSKRPYVCEYPATLGRRQEDASPLNPKAKDAGFVGTTTPKPTPKSAGITPEQKKYCDKMSGPFSAYQDTLDAAMKSVQNMLDQLKGDTQNCNTVAQKLTSLANDCTTSSASAARGTIMC